MRRSVFALSPCVVKIISFDIRPREGVCCVASYDVVLRVVRTRTGILLSLQFQVLLLYCCTPSTTAVDIIPGLFMGQEVTGSGRLGRFGFGQEVC